VPAIGPHHDPGVLDHGRPCRCLATDSRDAAVQDEELSNQEPLPDLGPRLGSGIDEQLVEDGPARAVGNRRLCDAGASRDGEGPAVEGVGVDGRASGGNEAIQQSPPLQRGNARRVDQVRRDRVARKRGLVDDEDLMALPGKQHRRRTPGAAPARGCILQPI